MSIRFGKIHSTNKIKNTWNSKQKRKQSTQSTQSAHTTRPTQPTREVDYYSVPFSININNNYITNNNNNKPLLPTIEPNYFQHQITQLILKPIF
jgi:hypothetical protein